MNHFPYGYQRIVIGWLMMGYAQRRHLEELRRARPDEDISK